MKRCEMRYLRLTNQYGRVAMSVQGKNSPSGCLSLSFFRADLLTLFDRIYQSRMSDLLCFLYR